MDTMINNAFDLQQQQIAMQTQVSVMKTTLKTQKMVGEAIISLIDSAVIGSDSRQGKSLSSGKNLDITG
jgi:hypothetical protein